MKKPTRIFRPILPDFKDCGLKASQKLQYIHKLFKSEAFRFYYAEIKGMKTT